MKRLGSRHRGPPPLAGGTPGPMLGTSWLKEVATKAGWRNLRPGRKKPRCSSGRAPPRHTTPSGGKGTLRDRGRLGEQGK